MLQSKLENFAIIAMRRAALPGCTLLR